MKSGRAFGAGVVAGLVTTGCAWFAREVLGMQVNLAQMLGALLLEPGAAAWVVGFAIHLLASGLIGLAYAWGFEHLARRAGPLVGAGFSLIHSLIAGAVFAVLPAMHPRIPEPLGEPGAFMAALGPGYVVCFFVLHGIYGAVQGALYAPAMRREEGRPAVV